MQVEHKIRTHECATIYLIANIFSATELVYVHAYGCDELESGEKKMEPLLNWEFAKRPTALMVELEFVLKIKCTTC